eukprot:TRINITY_DN206_c0_g1_i5.p3 TRINITY_DN206_c0_g1~~TRINITY_DN206_c0_g1_i5.p3  ORF type:complete len:103 (-),score=14.16 TRINITY_DN206_c0_g1_i5:30-338(-)
MVPCIHVNPHKRFIKTKKPQAIKGLQTPICQSLSYTVNKRRTCRERCTHTHTHKLTHGNTYHHQHAQRTLNTCLLYTSDAADDLLCVDLGGRRIIKKKKLID